MGDEILMEVRNISKKFKKKTIFEGINIRIKRGEIIGIIGASGAGKSVLIKTLNGFYKPSLGEVNIKSIQDMPIGTSTQHNSLYRNLTAGQNLDYFAKISGIKKKERKKIIDNLFKKMGIAQYEKILVKKLSGGTKKRVDISCAILKNPDILILDEPFLGLDPPLVKSLSKFIREYALQGKTVIISSHRTEELSLLCSRMLAMVNKNMYTINKNQIPQVYLIKNG